MEMARSRFASTQNPVVLTNAPECPYRNLLLVPTASALLLVAESIANRLPEVDLVSIEAVPSSISVFAFSLGQRGPPLSSL